MKKIKEYAEIMEKMNIYYNYDHGKTYNIKYYSDINLDLKKIIDNLNQKINDYNNYINSVFYEKFDVNACIDRSLTNSAYLNDELFLNSKEEILINCDLLSYGEELSYDIELDSLISILNEYKDKYKDFTEIKFNHSFDYRDNTRETKMNGKLKEDSVAVLYRMDIIKEYANFTDFLDKLILNDKKIDKELKEKKEYQKFLKLKEKYEKVK